MQDAAAYMIYADNINYRIFVSMSQIAWHALANHVTGHVNLRSLIDVRDEKNSMNQRNAR